MTRNERRYLDATLRNRDAVLRNPTHEGAMAFWPWQLLGPPDKPDAPLAGIHKARLKWQGATPAMVEESRRWLAEHGYRETIDKPRIRQ